jgi:hypothetical protein
MQPTEQGINFLNLLPPGASVTAVIIVVFVFLKFIKEMQADHKSTIKELTDTYNKQTSEDRAAYSTEIRETRTFFGAQVKEITDRFTSAIESIRAEIRNLTIGK